MKHFIYVFFYIVLLTVFSAQRLAMAEESVASEEVSTEKITEQQAEEMFLKKVESARKEYLENTLPAYDQSQPINFDDGFTKNRPYVIDASADTPEVLIDDYSGTFYLKIVNLVPILRHQYSFSISSQSINILPFEKTGSPDSLSSGQDGAESGEFTPLSEGNDDDLQDLVSKKIDHYCKKFHGIRDAIFAKKTETDVRDALGKFYEAIVTGKYALCPGYASDIKNTEAATTQELIFSVKRNKEYQISIERPKLTPKKVKVTGKNKQWLSHFGFAFVRNKSKSFYSADSGEASDAGNPTYTIEEQNDVDDYLYSAAVLLTYPFSVAGDWKFGITTGLGANNESIFLYLGPSVIVHENFLITAGFVIQEFDVLNGTYDEGQNIGEKPIDSDNLVQSTYKPSIGFSLGYRFSD